MILFVGDPHGDFRNINRAVKETNPAAIILLGDIESDRVLDEVLIVPPDIQVWWIPGNHEYEVPEQYDNILKSRWGQNNLHGRVVEIDGQRVAGFGGTFNRKIWMPPEDPVHETYLDWEMAHHKSQYFDSMRKDAMGAIYVDDYISALSLQADILVSHEAPSCHPYGHEAIDELAQSMGVKKAFHGHHHDDLDYSMDTERLGFEAFGVGLAGVKNILGTVIHEGKLDHERREKRTLQKQESRKFAM